MWAAGVGGVAKWVDPMAMRAATILVLCAGMGLAGCSSNKSANLSFAQMQTSISKALTKANTELNMTPAQRKQQALKAKQSLEQYLSTAELNAKGTTAAAKLTAAQRKLQQEMARQALIQYLSAGRVNANGTTNTTTTATAVTTATTH